MVNNKSSTFNNEFSEKSFMSKCPVVCNMLVRGYHEDVPGCVSNVMKGQQCHEFTICVRKFFAHSFLYYLYLFMIGFSLLPFVKVSNSLAEGNFFYIKKSC